MTLVAHEIGAWYRSGRPVLTRVAFRALRGRLLAVVGPNGAGKSTLIRILAGLRPPQRGHAELDGLNPAELDESQRAARIALAPQRASLAFPFSVREVVGFGTYARRDPGAVEAALGELDLLAAAAEPVTCLSLGQQQRVALAKAVAQVRARGGPDGRLLLADEPVAGLDPRHAVQAMEVLGGLASSGAIVVVVLHDLTLAARYADEVLVLAPGGTVAALDEPGAALDPAALERVYGIPFRRFEAGVIAAQGRTVHSP